MFGPRRPIEERKMPETHLYLAFIAATAVLMLIPGPNVALIVANSIRFGSRFGLLTVAGTSSAILVQLALTVLGLSAALGALAAWFDWIRWLGVAYLVFLGIRQWCSAPVSIALAPPSTHSAAGLYGRGFAVSLANPKTLLFYGAFFPQFISAGADALPQSLVLAATFLALAVAIDGSWALLAGRARFVLARHGRLRNRLSGGLLLGAGLGLALARRR
jgi:homoserine/homoserine lactone efflux protein